MALFETLGIQWQSFLWYVVDFFLVFYVLRRFAFAPIVRTLEKRSATIAEGLRDAHHAKELRRNAEAERDALLAAARKTAQTIVQDAHRDAERLRGDMLQRAKDEVDLTIRAGTDAIAQEKSKQLREAKEEIAELVLVALQKIVPRVFTKRDEEALRLEAAAVLREHKPV